MNTLALAAALLFVPVTAMAQTSSDGNLSQRLQQLEDRAALKTLVDTFSNLADQRDNPGNPGDSLQEVQPVRVVIIMAPSGLRP